jgi:sugar/nucleoside kinase (ribokinase family)
VLLCICQTDKLSTDTESALMVELGYLVVGHTTRDLGETSFSIGGTASYAARTARALGCRVGAITSADADLDLGQVLPDVLTARFLAATTTTFQNITAGEGRQQVILSVAKPLVPAMIPHDWRAAIVHIGPVAQECAPELVSAFGETFVGLTPQGWLRKWDETGQVSCCPMREMEGVLALADAVVLSLEDLGGDWELAADYGARAQLLALTQGPQGCTVFSDGHVRHFPALEVDEKDSTGAGDIFAASFFYALRCGLAPARRHDPWTAARFANCVAGKSVTRSGLPSTPSAEEVTWCRRAALLGHSTELL